MAPHKSMKAIDLFSGCGGLTSGLKAAGFDVAAAVEIESKARETYHLNHPEVWMAAEDVRLADPEKIMADLGFASGELDLLAGCPPCQGFSRIRKKNRKEHIPDKRNDLISDFGRFVRTMKPKFVMMENVPDVVNYHKFNEFLREITAYGYLFQHKVLDVSNFGVAQRRRRLVLVASRICVPMLSDGIGGVFSVREALINVGSYGNSGDALHDLPQRRTDKIYNLICSIPKNGGSRTDLPDELKLECHRRTNGFHDVYGRMKWESVAPTITGGCYNPSKGRFLHPEENRAITLREAAILQGFPGDYKFDIRHGREAISLMIGNALPPPFIAAHAKEIAKSIRNLEF